MIIKNEDHRYRLFRELADITAGVEGIPHTELVPKLAAGVEKLSDAIRQTGEEYTPGSDERRAILDLLPLAQLIKDAFEMADGDHDALVHGVGVMRFLIAGIGIGMNNQEIQPATQKLLQTEFGLEMDAARSNTLGNGQRLTRTLVAWAAVDWALARDDSEFSKNERAAPLLRGIVESEAPAIERAMAGDANSSALEKNKKLAALFIKEGRTGAEVAKTLLANEDESESAKQWDTRTRPYRPLAWVLWKEKIRPQLEREEKWKSPALSRQVFERLTDSLTKGLEPSDSGQLVSRDGRQLLLGFAHEVVDCRAIALSQQHGLIDRDRLAQLGGDGQLLSLGLSLVGSLSAHKLVRYVPRACFDIKIADQNADHRSLRFDSYDELAELAGIKRGKRNAEEARALVYVYDAFRVTLDNGSSDRLWTRGEYYEKTGKKGRPRRTITLTVSPMLLPHTQHRYFDDDRWLIPLVDVPPVVGSEHAGQQATMQLMAVGYMRSVASQIIADGGVKIDGQKWNELAARAGVPASLLPKVIDRWTRDGTDGAAFLKRVGCDRYTLAPAYNAALEFLKESGQLTISGREGARITNAKKAKRIGRKERK